MKEYPLTGQELWTLDGLGLAATVFFSAGSFFLSAWVDLLKDLAAPPPEMSAETRGYFKAFAVATGWASGISFAIGIVLTAVNGLNIFQIIRSTEHPE